MTNTGTLDVDAAMTANVINQNVATLAGAVTGTWTQNTAAGATTTVDGASSVSGLIDIDTGTLTVDSALTASSGVDVAAAAIYDQNAALTGNLTTASGNADIGANITGTVTQTAGQTNVDGAATITGLVDIDGGIFETDAATTMTAGFDVAGGAELQVDAATTLGAASLNAGTLDVNAALLGGQTVTNTGTLDVDGSITGNVLTSSVATLNGSVSGTFQQTAGTTTVDGATSLGILQNDAGIVTVDNALTLGGASTNAGTLNMNANILGGQTVTNTGTLNNDGANTLTGSLIDNSVINMVDGVTDDVLTVTGDVTLNGTVNVDVNVSGVAVGASGVDTGDLIAATGNVTGNTTLAFSNVGASTAALGTPIDVVTGADTTGLTAALSGLPTSGVFFYELSNTGSAVQLTSVSSPATGALASNIAATQGLISSVVNRPSSALVTPLVDPGDDPCAIGTWARSSAGRANADIDASSSTTTVTNQVDLAYRGMQVGIDRSCSGGFYNGWDLAYGGFLGMNGGKSTTPLSIGAASTLTTDFEQVFGGVYLSFARGNLFGDVQYRADRTTYDLSENLPFGAGGLGILDQSVDSTGKTISGSLSYAYTLNAETNTRLVPTIGFSMSNIATENVFIEGDSTTNTDDATIEIADIEQRLGYVGATLARTQVAASGMAATTYFVTGTFFNDFGSKTRSTVTSPSLTDVVESDTLGNFGEISLGFNRTAILDSGSALPARQLDASIRADSRFSDSLDSWGLTAQMRLQF